MADPVDLSATVDAGNTTGSTNETLVDIYNERAMDLLRLEAGTRDKVLVFLDELQSEIIGKIAKIDPTGIGSVARQRTRLTKLLKVVQDSIRGTYRDVSTLMGREIREVADIESTWTANAMNVATQAEFVDGGLTRQFLATLVSDVLIQGATSADWWSRQAAGLANSFADQMRLGMALGESNSDLVARVRGKTGVPGLMDVSRNSAERLVRASVHAASNTAREAMYDKNTDLIAALQWSATIDTRTSEWCLARDGCQYSPDTHEPIDDAPPWLEGPGKLHWGCRSTSVPILKSWQDLGIDEADVPETTRASMDGQVPAQTTYASWLAKQSAARQDEILGERKAQLYRSGKISVRDLLDQNGRPLTTEQLRAKAANK